MSLMISPRAIWKYPLAVTDRQSVSMPARAVILTVQMQNGTPHLWAEVDPEAPKSDRTIDTIGTGHVYDAWTDQRRYIGTYQTHGGSLVFHVFEVTA